jgi:lysyl-tRNA synthetase class I
MSDEDCIEIDDFNYDNLTIQYGCKEGKHGKCKIKQTPFGRTIVQQRIP